MSNDTVSRRSAHRQKVFQPGFGEIGDTRIALHILNISTSGARVHSVVPPSAGQHVALTCGVALGVAKVRWVSASYFGVQFVAPLAPGTIDEIAVSAGLKI